MAHSPINLASGPPLVCLRCGDPTQRVHARPDLLRGQEDSQPGALLSVEQAGCGRRCDGDPPAGGRMHSGPPLQGRNIACGSSLVIGEKTLLVSLFLLYRSSMSWSTRRASPPALWPAGPACRVQFLVGEQDQQMRVPLHLSSCRRAADGFPQHVARRGCQQEEDVILPHILHCWHKVSSSLHVWQRYGATSRKPASTGVPVSVSLAHTMRLLCRSIRWGVALPALATLRLAILTSLGTNCPAEWSRDMLQGFQPGIFAVVPRLVHGCCPPLEVPRARQMSSASQPGR